MPTHVYFDLDGTLTDPYEGISKCFLYALDELGFAHPSKEFMRSIMGPPLYDTFPEVVGQELTLKAVDLYRERFNDVGWQENIPYDGIHETLAAIAGTGCTLYVATSKPRIAATRIIGHRSSFVTQRLGYCRSHSSKGLFCWIEYRQVQIRRRSQSTAPCRNDR